jgi:deoxyribodipyrimidine photo-lyase
MEEGGRKDSGLDRSLVKTAIWWIRRDLRLDDNVALRAALGDAERVVPLFILDPSLIGSRYVGEKRLSFLYGGLRALEESLIARGSRLIVREGEPERVLGRVLEETGAESIFVEEDVSPYARRRDRRIASRLPLRGRFGVSFLSPLEVLKSDGEPYTVFTPYARAWKRVAEGRPDALWRAPARIATPRIESVPLPVPATTTSQVPGEEAAEKSLRRFIRLALDGYGEARNRLDLDGTSRLSPYLRFGMISSRRVVAAARRGIEEGRRGASAWLTELIWREFYLAILYHFPRVRAESFREEGRFVTWRDDEEDFGSWCAGCTGYPVVDAAMRQLIATGFMPNRARMVTAAFLTKHLLIDWRRGEEFFMKHLVDGDPSANNGGWQWSAGTGTDRAPYFRIFNPVLQGRRFDPEGRYVREWLPDLEGVERKLVHEPRRAIVSHLHARARALAAFSASLRTREQNPR